MPAELSDLNAEAPISLPQSAKSIAADKHCLHVEEYLCTLAMPSDLTDSDLQTFLGYACEFFWDGKHL